MEPKKYVVGHFDKTPVKSATQEAWDRFAEWEAQMKESDEDFEDMDILERADMYVRQLDG
jgi:hypothetical protein